MKMGYERELRELPTPFYRFYIWRLDMYVHLYASDIIQYATYVACAICSHTVHFPGGREENASGRLTKATNIKILNER